MGLGLFVVMFVLTALSLGPVRTAMVDSVMLGFGVASAGVLVMSVLIWIIYRSQLKGGERSSIS
jgi:iron(III) transport system permease protein